MFEQRDYAHTSSDEAPDENFCFRVFLQQVINARKFRSTVIPGISVLYLNEKVNDCNMTPRQTTYFNGTAANYQELKVRLT